MTKTGRTILVADDDAAIRTVVTQALTRAGYEVRATGTAGVLWRWVAAGDGDVVVTDVVMPDENIFDVLPRIRHLRPDIPVIVMSAQNTFMTAIKASERGAYDYLPKPFDLNELVSLVGRALAAAKPAAKAERDKQVDDIPLVGRSPAMQDIYRVLARLMQTDLTVIVTGESGTGKELVARALHDFGKRKRGPFVAINMAAIPKDLIESELFGHEKGAFTGAGQRSSGRFEQAEGGTLFLDEIGDMPMEAQTRLLRVLQQGEYTTVGGRTPIRTDVRIVAATNKDLLALIEQGLFREDLYYRLNVVPIRLPPLRDRSEDVPDLARHFLSLAEKTGLPRKSFQADALARLQAYAWPGNIRELENMVRRLVALYPDEVITAQAVEAELQDNKRPSFETNNALPPAAEGVRRVAPTPVAAPIAIAAADDEGIEGSVERHLAAYFGTFGEDLPPPGLYDRILREVERPLVAAALAATRGNQVKAADLLGLNRNTLRKKIKDLNIRMVSTTIR